MSMPEPAEVARPLPPAFAERLVVPLWWWPFGLAVGALLAAEVDSGNSGALAWLPYILVELVVLCVLAGLSQVRLRVQDGVLYVGKAHLPLTVVGAVRVLEPEPARRALGRDRDPTAFVVSRPWVHTAVWVRLDDPEDDTPYWLFTSRRPAELVAAVERARTAAG